VSNKANLPALISSSLQNTTWRLFPLWITYSGTPAADALNFLVMIIHRIPFYQLNTLLSAQLPKYFSYVSSYCPVNCLFPIFRNKYYVIFAIMFYVSLVLPVSHLWPSYSNLPVLLKRPFSQLCTQ